mgnify:CR=1 FL=1
MRHNAGFIYAPEVKHYSYGEFHPMKPVRLAMTYDLMRGYDLLSEFSLYVA